jgi:RNA polymerase sigma-70 factor (ECF subfamily)
VTKGDTPADEYPALVRAAQHGDRAALTRLLERAQEAAWRFSVMSCGHTDYAEDVMQDALLKAYRYAPRLREPEAFRAWLFKTVRNACLMNRRRRAGQPAVLLSLDGGAEGAGEPGPIDPVDPGRTPEEWTSNRRLRSRLVRALQTVPPAYRGVLVLRDVEGLSTREAARALRISEDNVKTRLRRGRLVLRAALAEGPRRDAGGAAAPRPPSMVRAKARRQAVTLAHVSTVPRA